MFVIVGSERGQQITKDGYVVFSLIKDFSFIICPDWL